MLYENLIFFLVSAVFLVISGIYLVKSVYKVSEFLRISSFSAAFIIVAFATSLPELFVGISSAVQGTPALSMGNVIGASIIDITLIIGIFIIANKGIETRSAKIGHENYFLLLNRKFTFKN